MSAVIKTPGVYIAEKSAFPNSVVAVATAVPAFIGYTEKADNRGRPLTNQPWRIASLAEFHDYFGVGPARMFKIEREPTDEGPSSPASASAENARTANARGQAAFSFNGRGYQLRQESGIYLLYSSMRLFYQNGGGPCYIVSVGNHGDDIEADKLQKGIDRLIKEQEPTMVVIPDAVLLDARSCISVQQAAVAHCGGKMKNRVSILDIHNGYKDRRDPDGDCVEIFRSSIGNSNLDYAAAYYPWLNTSIVQNNELSYENIHEDSRARLRQLLTEEVSDLRDNERQEATAEIEKLSTPPTDESDKKMLEESLRALSPRLYGSIIEAIKDTLNLLPPGGAMAGVYTMVDNCRGVWKAPASVSLNAVLSPSVNITNDEQEDLNVALTGKSINAIRTFIGQGTLVWGARTLDGNSLDWRYISVRRTMIWLRESIKLAMKAYVFEDNAATTWVTVKSMISNFLIGIWKRGGLAGASPNDAFTVHCGLGETMTPEDISEGILRVTVLVALTRPAEFIEITIQQQMQKSKS